MRCRRDECLSTYVLRPQERERAFTLLRGQIKDGKQAFIIYPLIEESDKIEARAAVDDYETTLEGSLPRPETGLAARADAPAGKRRGDAQVPRQAVSHPGFDHRDRSGGGCAQCHSDADRGADRFGLAQLHQLRGRVGAAQTSLIVC